MKICILGNSHAAALKHGWDRIAADHPGIALHIYTMVGQNLGAMERDGRRLVYSGDGDKTLRRFPRDIAEAVELDHYDGFILHGLGLHVRPLGLPGLSAAVRAAIVQDSVRDTALWTLLEDIRAVSRAPVRAGHTPLPAADTVETRGPSEDYRSFLARAQAECFEARDARLLAQPEDTIVNGLWTDPAFNTDVVPVARDAARAEGTGERHTDRAHMNPAFGAAMMTRYLESF